MSRRPRAQVLDSWAVLAFFEGAPAGQAVAGMIAQSRERRIPLAMSAVNAGEVWYIVAREVSEQQADETIEALRRMDIEIVDVDWPLTRAAAAFKAHHRMSYADCYAAALAQARRAELVTGDREFKEVEGAVRIQWLES